MVASDFVYCKDPAIACTAHKVSMYKQIIVMKIGFFDAEHGLCELFVYVLYFFHSTLILQILM